MADNRALKMIHRTPADIVRVPQYGGAYLADARARMQADLARFHHSTRQDK